MKKKILLFFSLFFALFGYSQQNDLKQYYININKAELAIVDSNYANALENYEEAFRFKPYPFAQDLYNATLVSIITNTYPKAINYLERLFKIGFQLSGLDSISICEDFLNSSSGNEAKLKNKKSKPIYNLKYRKAIEKMVYDDQYFRMQPNGYKIYGDTIRKTDSINVAKFLKLINKYGFPSEEKIGLNPNSLVSPTFLVLIFHQNAGAKYQTYNYSGILKSALLQGELRNNIAAMLIQSNDGIKYYDAFGMVKAKFDTTFILTDDSGNLSKKDTTLETKWGYFKLNDSEIKKFNTKREEIYLGTIEENVRKIAFGLKNNYFLLNPTGDTSVFKTSKYEDFLHMKSNLIYPR